MKGKSQIFLFPFPLGASLELHGIGGSVRILLPESNVRGQDAYTTERGQDAHTTERGQDAHTTERGQDAHTTNWQKSDAALPLHR